MTCFREKQVLSFYSQHFLYHIDGKLCPGGRGPQFVFSLQLGSCGHVVEGVSQLGGHVVEGVSWSCSLEKLAQQGKQDAHGAMWPP